MKWANRSLDWITIKRDFFSFFPQLVRTNVADLLLTFSDDNIQWKFLFGSYIPRHRLESVILKYSIHTGAVTDSLTYTP